LLASGHAIAFDAAAVTVEVSDWAHRYPESASAEALNENLCRRGLKNGRL
jgi:hypothetical protein